MQHTNELEQTDNAYINYVRLIERSEFVQEKAPIMIASLSSREESIMRKLSEAAKLNGTHEDFVLQTSGLVSAARLVADLAEQTKSKSNHELHFHAFVVFYISYLLEKQLPSSVNDEDVDLEDLATYISLLSDFTRTVEAQELRTMALRGNEQGKHISLAKMFAFTTSAVERSQLYLVAKAARAELDLKDISDS